MPNTLHALLFCALAGLPALSFSQTGSSTTDPRGSQYVSVGVGTLTTNYLLDGYRPGRPTEYDYANHGVPAATNISYTLKLSRRCYLALTENIEQEEGDWLDNEIPGGNVFDLQTSVKGAFVRTAFTTAVDFIFDYRAAAYYRVYSDVGLGATYEVETDQYNPAFYTTGYYNGRNNLGPMRQENNKMRPNFYYAPVGMSVGRKLCYFVELGFGYKGVVNTGVSYKF